MPLNSICGKRDATMTPTPLQQYIFNQILAERARQDEKFGEQLHTPPEWVMIIAEEMGEVAKEALEYHFNSKSLDNYLTELVQLAAVCCNAIEAHLKNEEANINDAYSQDNENMRGHNTF